MFSVHALGQCYVLMHYRTSGIARISPRRGAFFMRPKYLLPKNKNSSELAHYFWGRSKMTNKEKCPFWEGLSQV